MSSEVSSASLAFLAVVDKLPLLRDVIGALAPLFSVDIMNEILLFLRTLATRAHHQRNQFEFGGLSRFPPNIFRLKLLGKPLKRHAAQWDFRQQKSMFDVSDTRTHDHVSFGEPF